MNIKYKDKGGGNKLMYQPQPHSICNRKTQLQR